MVRASFHRSSRRMRDSPRGEGHLPHSTGRAAPLRTLSAVEVGAFAALKRSFLRSCALPHWTHRTESAAVWAAFGHERF
jgi:hypothetical protein